ncbi:MAG: metal-sensing transcriptional repressor [Planctomycetaceae bacterium]|nr:metal-sensing transcriptional repressor [Planctomycetaceae bacterium]
MGASERLAVAVDPDVVERNLKRLRRIEGQVRGLQKMVAEGRYCADILVQVSAVNQALRGVRKELLRNHLKHCAAAAWAKGGAEAEAMQGELLDLVFRHADGSSA